MHVDYMLAIDDLPQECIEDCSHPGRCDEDVAFWRKKLKFTVDREQAIICLKGYGAWSQEELEALEDDDLAEKVLWLACGDFREFQNNGADCGSDIFVLE